MSWLHPVRMCFDWNELTFILILPTNWDSLNKCIEYKRKGGCFTSLFTITYWVTLINQAQIITKHMNATQVRIIFLVERGVLRSNMKDKCKIDKNLTRFLYSEVKTAQKL